MNVTLRPTPAGALFESTKSPAFAREEAEVQSAKASLDGFQRRLADTDHLLSLSAFKRVRACDHDIAHRMWNDKAKFHSSVAAHLAIFAAAGLGAAAMLSGVQPILGLLAGGGLAYGYVMLQKHVIMPMQIDKMVRPALEQEQRELKAAVAHSEQRLQASKQALLKGVQESMRAPAPIEVNEASVTVGGVRIKVRK